MRIIPKRKVLAEIVRDGSVIKVYDKDVLNMLLNSNQLGNQENTINLNEFCRGLTMEECLEKIKREVPDYRRRIYSITIDL